MKDMQAMKDIKKWVKEKEIKEMKEKRGKHWHKLGYRLMLEKWVNVKEEKAEKFKARVEGLHELLRGVALERGISDDEEI